MRKLMIALLAVATAPAWAQNFEGTIKWSMKMEITDPKAKAEMEEAQKKMNDPAVQAQMKQALDQMNDPKMKAMMDANPQMKAMMESKMKMMQGGDMMSNIMPKGWVMKMKDGNTLMSMDGGMMAGDMLHLKANDQTVRLNSKDKTYSVMPSGDGASTATQQQPTVTKTSETMKILNYNCTKYVITMSEHGQTMTTTMWTTTDIKGVDMKAMAKQRMGHGQSMFYSNVDGMPLRIEVGTPQGKMIMEVTDFKAETLNAADFTIPSDYKETKGMFGRN